MSHGYSLNLIHELEPAVEPLLRLTLYEQRTRGNVKIEKLLNQQYWEIMSGNTFQSALYSQSKLPKKQSSPTV